MASKNLYNCKQAFAAEKADFPNLSKLVVRFWRFVESVLTTKNPVRSMQTFPAVLIGSL